MSTIGDWRMKFFKWAGLPIIAFIGLFGGATDLVPAWHAHNGSGTPGTFTALRYSCGRHDCDYHGDWTAADGSSSREDVILYDEPAGVELGAEVPALDSGARAGVFGTEGGTTYLLMTGLALGGVAALIGWGFVLAGPLRRWRARVARREDAKNLF
ncbi:hypothetical protein Cs7R123_39860 [Catellatospora sp. TT07R-123]|uniref:hypothetical protein n=1 Tax=Catellatospora sp. TT07R-123 TaxID=2733863 RepID=UPI001B2A371C|nr:hypothetical protein [Catellatospora sp. TT07R-123]GHJ46644.1 hypothetical protein Cs7R123_39860 [Catellatospora sp. TT07R-123]